MKEMVPKLSMLELALLSINSRDGFHVIIKIYIKIHSSPGKVTNFLSWVGREQTIIYSFEFAYLTQ